MSSSSSVHVAIYDLSHGMAKTLSAQFLGPNHVIDMIPHTGLLVFGKEYFFGGGIQAMEPHAFRQSFGIHPVRVEPLGTTHVSQQEFETWCQTLGRRQFNANSYDLLQNNCNHFSHHAALEGLKLPNGIADWILQVPQTFLSSPMGAMMRPILEQQMKPIIPHKAQMAPFSVPQNHPLTASGYSSPAATADSNPWANVALADDSTKPAAVNPVEKIAPATTTTWSSSRSGILDKYTKPMISQDTMSVNLCRTKLLPHLSSNGNDETAQAMELICQTLGGGKKIDATPLDDDPKISKDQEKQQAAKVVTDELWRLLRNETEGTSTTTSVTSFALLLLRLIVLQYPEESAPCLQWIVGQLATTATTEEEGAHTVWKTRPTWISLAWCVMSNYTAAANGTTTVLLLDENATTPSPDEATTTTSPSTTVPLLVEAAIRDWNHPSSMEIRQAACAFLYNYVLKSNLDEDTMVSIICSFLENILPETDPMTRLRRLLVCGRVVWRNNDNNNNNNDSNSTTDEVAKALLQDLGVCEILRELQSTHDAEQNDNKETTNDIQQECHQLSLELLDRLQDCEH